MHDFAPLPADSKTWALFLDIDGTLLDLAPTPDAVVVPDSLPALLDSLGRRLSGALALISGRSLAAIDRLFPGGRDAAGTHGAELRRAGLATALAEPWPEELNRMLEERARRLPGVLVERKTRSVALHFSQAPEQEAAVRALAEATAKAATQRLDLLTGKSVVEIIPAGTGKGAAIDRFMQEAPYAGRHPVFAGDDVTDESGFAAINRMGGISIHVGDSPNTAARYRFATPDSLRHWLAGLDRAWAEGGTNGQP